MELGTFIERQLEMLHAPLAGLLGGVSQAEWVAAPAPGQNPTGFTAWQIVSIQDWAICTWMRNVPTIRSRPEWATKGLDTAFLPFGMDGEVATALAAATRPADVVAYSEAVLGEARRVLAELADLEGIPPNQGHLTDARYQASPEYMDEAAEMRDFPFWRIFGGACIGHTRGHLGELDLALSLIRTRQ